MCSSQQRLSLLIYNLFSFGQRMIDGRLLIGTVVCTNEPNALDLTIQLSADVSCGAELATLFYRHWFDLKTVILDAFTADLGWFRLSA